MMPAVLHFIKALNLILKCYHKYLQKSSFFYIMILLSKLPQVHLLVHPTTTDSRCYASYFLFCVEHRVIKDAMQSILAFPQNLTA